MKALKTLKFVFIIAAMFTFSACELIEEPNFDTTETGGSQTETAELGD
ncbi:hypothetical protein MATR_24740 [Marivirga tractuosa]|uniref:Uncharacterized protein n=1 Tax=Marivirga tractuosa (strain ATCC 23168 / DSM 4126 / NBRC 15989 / NCIMB 1408 / VKM B-1430 / H-43) TaxID=643867 RepID=E4TQH7_MARTH|nr:hypothetical protein [Marivirga tractuosa]ADR23670.1 hypothetical protein Ftrac_3703 [Marivirga tractuosa DSM 4126]BDD15649.1 hypothetical protein MATR_24740 [Marivirga tractuosa]